MCAGWATWHTPAYIPDFIPPESESLLQQMGELHHRKDVTSNMPGLFGGYADALDRAALILVPIFLIVGARTVRCASMEYEHGRPGSGPLYILAQKIFDLLTEYVLISVPLFILMASLLERSGVAKSIYDSLDFWLSRVRGGIAIVTSVMAVLLAAMSGIIGGEIVLLGLMRTLRSTGTIIWVTVRAAALSGAYTLSSRLHLRTCY